MSGKYSFHLQSADPRRDLPSRLIIGQRETETPAHVLLKLLGYLLFHRARLQIEPALHDANRNTSGAALRQRDAALGACLLLEDERGWRHGFIFSRPLPGHGVHPVS